jgi:hypothetical protein
MTTGFATALSTPTNPNKPTIANEDASQDFIAISHTAKSTPPKYTAPETPKNGLTHLKQDPKQVQAIDSFETDLHQYAPTLHIASIIYLQH